MYAQFLVWCQLDFFGVVYLTLSQAWIFTNFMHFYIVTFHALIYGCVIAWYAHVQTDRQPDSPTERVRVDDVTRDLFGS
jgi:hypothetical protein